MRPDLAELRQRFRSLRLWRSPNGERAPHKPLLVLWAIGRCLRGEERLAPFSLVETKLRDLLRDFGPPRRASHPEFPFWRLRGDGIWEIDRPELVGQTASGDAYVRDLRQHQISGGFLASHYAALRAEPQRAHELASEILHAHFPVTYHADVLRATGIGSIEANSQSDTFANTGRVRETHEKREVREERELYETTRRRRRAADFKAAVLKAYAEQCAVCAFSVRLEGTVLAVEAAHIHWHSHAGPSVVRNGIALCALHHRLFDRGAFTLDDSLVIRISTQAAGHGHHDALGRFNGTALTVVPDTDADRPASEFLSWHRRLVLRP